MQIEVDLNGDLKGYWIDGIFHRIKYSSMEPIKCWNRNILHVKNAIIRTNKKIENVKKLKISPAEIERILVKHEKHLTQCQIILANTEKLVEDANNRNDIDRQAINIYNKQKSIGKRNI